MKKHTRLAALLLSVFMLFALAACGGEKPSESKPTPDVTPDATAQTKYFFTTGGTDVIPGTAMEPLLSSLGEARDVFESPSCAFEGVDKIYYYPGFVINTYPVDGADFVLSVVFQDDTVQTNEGVYLGMTSAQVEEAYGTGTWNDLGNQLRYTDAGCELVFLFENDALIDISYYQAEAQAAVEAAA